MIEYVFISIIQRFSETMTMMQREVLLAHVGIRAKGNERNENSWGQMFWGYYETNTIIHRVITPTTMVYRYF